MYYIINEFGEEEVVKHQTGVSYKRTVFPNDKITARGTKSSVKRDYLRHYHYVDSLNCLSTFDVQQNLIRSKQHTISSVSKKIGLNAFDNKRYILDDGVHTLAHGHWRCVDGLMVV